MDEKVQKVLDYIEEHKEEYLELLLRFCRQPSVAATGEGIEKMAGATASFMPAAWPTTKTALSPACVRWMHGRKCTASCR